jgi:hypothetical protein
MVASFQSYRAIIWESIGLWIEQKYQVLLFCYRSLYYNATILGNVQ